APLLMLSIASTTDVSAASAVGVANATVIATPSSVSPINISIALPSINTRPPTPSGSTPTTAALIGGAADGSSDTVTVAGISVANGGTGSTVSFSIAGDTTSAYVVELGQAQSGGARPDGATQANTAAGGAGSSGSGTSSLIVSSQPLSGSGRLAIVLSQAPSDLIAGAISLSVNYN
ncbi:MAG: hypothetical protein Q7U14_18400, partial [Lacisediminimonas sp.]|nr:hypothetical protein [Lacisediminimonas sp.]